MKGGSTLGQEIQIIPIECKFGPTSAYAYYIDAPEPALIDTGIASSVSQEITEVLEQHGKCVEDIRWILLTHGHVDHLGGAYALWEKTAKQAKVVISKKEAYLLKDRAKHLDDYKVLQGKYLSDEVQQKHRDILMQDIGDNIPTVIEVEHGSKITLGDDIFLTVIETPGHSLGSVTFVLDEQKWAFAADAVQIYGGAKSGIPTIEEPMLYRQSIQYLLEEVKPTRLYLGHHFRDASGNIASNQLEGEKVVEALEACLDMDEKISVIVQEFVQSGEQKDEGRYRPFTSIAEKLGYTGDPTILPCAFYVTVGGYYEKLIKNVGKGGTVQ